MEPESLYFEVERLITKAMLTLGVRRERGEVDAIMYHRLRKAYRGLSKCNGLYLNRERSIEARRNPSATSSPGTAAKPATANEPWRGKSA